MKKLIRFILVVIICVFCLPVSAQIRFKKYFQPTWSSMIFPQADGTYRMIYMDVGFMGGCPGTMHFVKLDSTFTVVSRKTYDAGYCDMMYDVVQHNNEFLIGGLSLVTQADTGRRSLMKIDIDGNLIWHGRYGSSAYLNVYTTYAIFAESDSALGIGHANPSTQNTFYGTYLFKAGVGGNLLWGRVFYNTSDNLSPGGKMIMTRDGGYLIPVNYGSGSNFRSGLIKTNPKGDILWSRVYNTPPGRFCAFIRIVEGPSGEFYIGCTANDPTGNYYNVALVKCDSLGNVLSSKAFDYGANLAWFCNDYIATADSGIAFIAESYTNMTLFKIDKNMDLQWMRIYEGTMQTYNLAQTNDSGFIFASYDPYPSGNDRYSYIKTDKNGYSACQVKDTITGEYPFLVYDSTINVSFYNEGFRSPSLLTTANSSTFGMVTSCYCDPHADFNFTVSGDTIFFTNTSINADSSWWSFGDGIESDGFSPSHLYADNNFYNVTLIIKDGNCYDTITKTLQVDVGINENVNSGFYCDVFPNPFSGATRFILRETGDFELRIFDLTGKLLDKRAFSTMNFTYENSNVSPGIYLYEIENRRHQCFRGKLVIE